MGTSGGGPMHPGMGERPACAMGASVGGRTHAGSGLVWVAGPWAALIAHVRGGWVGYPPLGGVDRTHRPGVSGVGSVSRDESLPRSRVAAMRGCRGLASSDGPRGRATVRERLCGPGGRPACAMGASVGGRTLAGSGLVWVAGPWAASIAHEGGGCVRCPPAGGVDRTRGWRVGALPAHGRRRSHTRVEGGCAAHPLAASIAHTAPDERRLRGSAAWNAPPATPGCDAVGPDRAEHTRRRGRVRSTAHWAVERTHRSCARQPWCADRTEVPTPRRRAPAKRE